VGERATDSMTGGVALEGVDREGPGGAPFIAPRPHGGQGQAEDPVPTTDARLTGVAGEARDETWYRRMAAIRRFEERLLGLFETGQLHGTTHACIGQEANAVGVIEHLRPGDHIFSNHRCHGHYLAWTGDFRGLLREVTGAADGVCDGIGGSQHLCAPGFKSNGVLGGTVPAAAGIALAGKLDGLDAVSVVFMGDGALGEGVVYESLNLASLWSLPLFVVVENNRYAQSTPIGQNLAGDIAQRFAAFGFGVSELETFDVGEISATANQEIAEVRRHCRPRALVLHTYRLCHHSKNDDNRPLDEVERYRSVEPLVVQRPRLVTGRSTEIDDEVESALEVIFADVGRLDGPSPSAIGPGGTE